MGIKFKKTASCLPEKIVDNFYFEKILDTSDEWIRSRTGISQRHFVEEESMFDLVKTSVLNLNLSAEEKEKIKFIIVATCSSAYAIPSLACQIQEEMNLNEDIYSLDINMACSGFVAGLRLIDGMIKPDEMALLIGVEVFSKMLDFTDRNTAILFGDGAGAVLLEHTEKASHFTSGTRGNKKALNHGFSKEGLSMDGRDVYKFGVTTMETEIKRFLNRLDMKVTDIDLFITHQANIRMLDSIAKSLGVAKDKVPSNIDQVGNISAASIPVLLDQMNQKGQLKSGDQLMISGFGAGLTWVLAQMEW